MPVVETTISDVRQLVEAADLKHLSNWWVRRYPSDMRRFVIGFRHRILYQITPEDVYATCKASSHSLGNIEKREDIPQTRDAHVNYAMEYLFHDLLERQGKLPTWDEFWEDLRSESRRPLWYDPMMAVCRERNLNMNQAERGLQWRLGNLWNSAIREVHLIASLGHEHRVPVKYHMLADVLLRVDAWNEHRLLYSRVPNSLEKRKSDPSDWFPSPAYRVHRLAANHRGFGRVWLYSGTELERAATFFLGT